MPNSIGGGIFSNGNMTVNSSTISNNTAGASGGGIFSEGTLNMHNSTLSNNNAGPGSGGAILNLGNLSISSSTVTGNRAVASDPDQAGGGIRASGTETLTNTIVAGNLIGTGSTPDDINSTIETANFNLIGDAASSGGIVNGTNGNIVGNNGSGTRDIATILNPTLANNGGATLTHALVTGSPALDAGSNALAPSVDQRGASRPFDGPDANTIATADIGAVEQGSTPNANNLVVNKIADTNDGSCTANDCSLREAITAANLDGMDSAITFDIAGAGPHTITLNSALPNLSTNINIDNADTGAEAVTLSRNTAAGTPAFRIFFIPIGVNVSLSGLTISNGSAPFGGGIDNRGTLNLSNCTLSNNSAIDGTGGGIDNDGTLNVSNCIFSNNSADHGGCITSFGTLNMTNSTVSNNFATNGGGIFNGSAMTLSNCTIISNFAASAGGGINNSNTATVSSGTDCTISNNLANDFGGGIYNNGGTLNLNNSTLSGNLCNLEGGAIAALGGTLNMVNSTISNNSAVGQGGGIINTASLNVSSCTITGNRADSDGTEIVETGGGINAIGTENLSNTIVAGNLRGSGSTPDDINNGAIETANSNLIGDAASSGGITHGTNGNIVGNNGTGTRAIGTILNPTLANNGGPTLTHALVNRSPAINKGNSALPTDQRGVVRPQGKGSDIGAYEAILLTIGDVSVKEGDSGTRNAVFPVTLSAASPISVQVGYDTVDNASARPGSDFEATALSDSDGATPGTLTIPAGQTTGSITVPIRGDSIDEDNEFFYILLSSQSGLAFSRGRGKCIILDDDRAPAITIQDVTIAEGHSSSRTALFTLNLSAPSGQLVAVQYATANGTARSGSDYTAVPLQTVRFGIGQTSVVVRVPVTGDKQVEPDETFYVLLKNASNASIARGRAAGTITNDDSSG